MSASSEESLFEINKVIIDLREKLRKSLNEVLKLRKDLDLSREENQLIELKYNNLKDSIDREFNHRLDIARGAIKEVVDDGNKK
jgi:regulator of replication initiation timing